MINAETRLIALIGNPVGHSLGPAMHNAAFQNLGLNYVYLAFNVAHLKTAVEAMKELSFAGFSVTIPHKEKILKHLDRVDPVAAKIQAANTVVNSDGLLVGHNTDLAAAMNALKSKTPLEGKYVALLGAGGAARAIAFGLQAEKANVTIFNRTFERAKALARATGSDYAPFDKINEFKADILINATSIGMAPDANESPLKKEVLKNFPLIFDIVYNPLETRLLKLAKSAGCETIAGIEMFVEQGAEQFKLWTGKEAPKDLMRETVLAELDK